MVPHKINILYMIDYFHRTGGTEKHLAQMVLHLPRDKFKCTIVVFDLGTNALIDKVRDSGTPVIHVPVSKEYTPNAFIRAMELSHIIRMNDFDIVQTFHQKSDSYGAVIAKLSGVKHIISSKRDIGQIKKSWHFFINRICKGIFDKFIVVADAVGEVIVEKEKIDRSRIIRIYNGVDEMEFMPAKKDEIERERNRLGLSKNDFVIGMVAGFRPEKSYDVFFEGALKASEVIPDLKILAVGGGPLLEFFRNTYSRETISSKIIFTGDVKNVKDYLKVMDVGCLIPRSNEGFSNSVLEKMSMGLPLIVTDVGGNAEAVINWENGLIIPPENVDAFSNALMEMYSDPAARIQMGQKSRQFIEERFTLKQMCKTHEMLYLSIAADHH